MARPNLIFPRSDAVGDAIGPCTRLHTLLTYSLGVLGATGSVGQRFILLLALHAFQVALAIDTGRHSIVAIRNLLEMEPTGKKAAKFSKAAADHLHQIQKTQAAGVVAVSELNPAIQHPSMNILERKKQRTYRV